MVNICLSCDNNYVKYANVVAASVLANLKENAEINFYILDGDISDENKLKFLKIKELRECNISFVTINKNDFKIFETVKTHNYITIATYYRLKLASLLPSVDRIIYLDCDTIVNSDISELFDYDLENNPVGAVLDARVKHKRKYKNSNYVNAGIVVFDLNCMRKNNVEKELMAYIEKEDCNIDCGDQDIINYALKDRIKILSDEWNVQVSGFASRTSFTNNPKIVHYIGSDKPWKFGSNTYFKDLYFKYLQHTAWALSEEEKQKWLIENRKISRLNFWKRRYYCLFVPKYWYAFYKSVLYNLKNSV